MAFGPHFNLKIVLPGIENSITKSKQSWDIFIFDSSAPGQNGRHFADDDFMNDFFFCILIKISLKFVSKGSIDNNLALV